MKSKTDGTFRQLRRKLFFRTAALLALAVGAVYTVYTALLRGNFAQWVLSLLQTVFGVDYDAALELYERVFRSHMDGIIILSMLAVFLLLFLVYLRWFAGYFREISRGLDSLLQGTPGEISLAPELMSIERKLNQAKHTLEQQKSETALSEQRKNDLIMYLAHDLKTPLASAISYLNLLRDEKRLSEELREKYLAISLSKAERLEDLINEFLEIAKYNLSTITLQYSEINLTRLLEQLVFELQPVLAQKGLTCRLEVEENVTLRCDGEKMQRVFDNLLRNAVLYSNEGAEISVEARREEERVTLRFANLGATIPPEKLERIFEQFYRLDAGRGTEGSGLGLAIARQIVTLHGGTVGAESGDGRTIFTVTLPVL